MNYPGSPSLSQDTQQRILTTFDQTLTLAEQGNRQEALLGCDFILRMDPQFEPARQLHDRLKAASGPVAVHDLRNGGAPNPLLTSEDLFGDLSDLGDDLPADLADLEELPAAGGNGTLRADLERLLAEHRLPELMALAGREQARVMADPQLAALVQNAQERLEAEPYVNKFLAKAREILAAGPAADRAEVGRLLEKARALDPTHPGITELARQASGAAAPPAAAPARPEPTLPSALPANPPAFDLFEGRPGGDAESERRIAQLLAEGQTAFDGGDHQGAIDAWSRIFLIDIDHQEAARRIEQARKLKAERERQVEEIFHDGVGRLEAGDVGAAKAAFEQVLTLQPGYLAAREYLQQIESGDLPAFRGGAAAAGREPGALPDLPLPSYEDDERSALLKEEILVPPDVGGAAGRAPEKREARRSTVAVKSSNPRRTFLAVGSAVLVLVLVAAFYLYQNKDRFWPNSDTDEVVAPAPTQADDPIQRATRLHEQGKTPIAIRQLQRLVEGDAQYEEAQKLIAEWQGGPAAPAGTEPVLAPEIEQRRQVLLAAARQSFASGRHLAAEHRFEQAASLAPLAPEDATQLAQAKNALAPFSSQVALFRSHDWETVLPQLWRLHDEDPANPVVRQMLTDSYYNLAVRDLQRADVAKATERLAEAVKLTPEDEALRRHARFAEAYQGRDKDLLYRIYVKYLPVR